MRLRRSHRLLATSAATVCCAAATGLLLGGTDFLRQHFAPLLLCATVLVATGSLLVRTAAGIVRGAALSVRRPRALGESGAAMAEFAIVIIPFLLTLFALMQLALASMARVLVSYSAFCAARAAIVLLPVDTSSGSNSMFSPAKGKEMANHIGYGANTRLDFTVSQKASFIRNAASYPLIAASPAIDTVVGDTMNNWQDYWQNRKQAGVGVLGATLDLLQQTLKLPPAMEQNFNDQAQQILSGPLDTPAEKAAAKQKIDALAGTLPPWDQAQARSQLDAYIDAGGTGAPPAQGGSWVAGTIDDALQGGLGAYKNQILGSMPTNQAGDFKGYNVARALDQGLGGNMDGASGAMLRVLRKLIYARIGTVVTLEDQNGGVKSKFGWGDPVTAKVTYLCYLQIPLANRIAGKPFYDLPASTQLDMTTGSLGYGALVGIPGYFLPLTARHTLINQGTP